MYSFVGLSLYIHFCIYLGIISYGATNAYFDEDNIMAFTVMAVVIIFPWMFTVVIFSSEYFHKGFKYTNYQFLDE